jgi:hypothetical protein
VAGMPLIPGEDIEDLLITNKEIIDKIDFIIEDTCQHLSPHCKSLLNLMLRPTPEHRGNA